MADAVMIEILETDEFRLWVDGLRDAVARLHIARRIQRLSGGLFGDAKSVGGGGGELRINHRPGYRVYYIQRGWQIVVLLCGGDKGSQIRDIERAKALAKEL